MNWFKKNRETEHVNLKSFELVMSYELINEYLQIHFPDLPDTAKIWYITDAKNYLDSKKSCIKVTYTNE